MRARMAIAAVGVLLGMYGAYELLGRGWSNLVASGLWLAGLVIAHDFVLAPLTLAVTAVAAPVITPRYRGVAAAALVVIGTITVLAIPVLGRFGARPDNDTLLDRPYWWGWFAFVALVGLVSAVWLVLNRVQASPDLVD